jgi:hypothetical protein
MIKFELVDLEGGCSQENSTAVVYLQGQSYVMFNKLQIKLDRVLDAKADWVGCYLDSGLIYFMQSANGILVVAQSAKILSTTISEILVDDDSDDEHEEKLSAMRLKQAATLHRALNHASESIKDISSMLKAFDCKMECEFSHDEGAKLGILESLRKCRRVVSLDDIEYTLKLMENECTAIIYEELDIPPPKRQRLFHH